MATKAVAAKRRKTAPASQNVFWANVKRDYRKHKWVYWMAVPVILYYLVFLYAPMAGQIIAFQDYRPAKGILESDWVGLENFIDFFQSPFAFRTIRNTIMISFLEILVGFPAPIILALMFNEIRCKKFKSITQTISYLPHFISLVVACGIVVDFVRRRRNHQSRREIRALCRGSGTATCASTAHMI